MSKNSLTVAITGGIGSGKSTFAEYLKLKNYPVLFADEISRAILNNNEELKNKIIKNFGSSAYKENQINADFLSQEIFSDPAKLQKINSIIHPAVINEIISQTNVLKKNNKLVFVEAALVYEANVEKLFDYVVLVTADEQIRKKRALNTEKFSAEEFDNRMKNQIKDEEKSKRADFVFYNNSSKKDLKQKADLLLMTLNALLK